MRELHALRIGRCHFLPGKAAIWPSGQRDFELGLFMGALARKRAFVVAPHGKNLKIPTDTPRKLRCNRTPRPFPKVGGGCPVQHFAKL